MLAIVLDSIAHLNHSHESDRSSVARSVACGYCTTFGGLTEAPWFGEPVSLVRNRFDVRLLKQQRVTEQLQFLSPTLIAQQTLTRISGTDESRYAAVRWQAGNYLYELRQVIGRMAMADEPLTVERLRSLPKFVQADPLLGTTLRAVAWPLGLLCAVSLVLAGFSRVRLEDQR